MHVWLIHQVGKLVIDNYQRCRLQKVKHSSTKLPMVYLTITKNIHLLNIDDASTFLFLCRFLPTQNKYHQMFRDLVDYWYEWLFITSLMILYVCLVFFLPVPGCPT